MRSTNIKVAGVVIAMASTLSAQRVDVNALFDVADVRMRNRIAEALNAPTLRWLTRRDASASTWSGASSVNWDSGYFPGLMWQMYRRTGDVQYRTWGKIWTNALVGLGPNDAMPNPINFIVGPPDHDAGLTAMTAFAEGWASIQDPGYARVVHQAAKQLQSRFVPSKGVIRSWNWEPGAVPVIIDGMMSVQALSWSSSHGGDVSLNATQLIHSLSTAANHMRADGSSYHLVNYGTTPPWRGTVQGYDSESTWARGQAWAIYGFTESYRQSNNATLLTTALAAADFFLDHLPADGMPLWDLELPSGMPASAYRKDSSAAAIAASGLIRLSETTTVAEEQRRYFQAAEALLHRVSSPDYLASSTPGETRILLHAVGNYNGGAALDSSLVYSDFYFLEALDRYEQAFPGPGIRQGDANRDGNVNFDDLLILARHYGAFQDVDWLSGDFSGDGTTNFDDLLQLAQNYDFGAVIDSSTLAAPDLIADWTLARSLTPEPAMLSILGFVSLSPRRRRASSAFQN